MSGSDDRFPAGEKVQGQMQSRSAYQQLADRLEEFAWWQDYRELRALGWDWRKAVYIAWAASPAINRYPATQEELAIEVLGLTSDRTIRKWREKYEEIDDQIAAMQAAPLLRHRRDVFDALVASASSRSHLNHQDRKLFLEMTGDYRRDREYDVSEEPVAPEHVQSMLDTVYGGGDEDEVD